MGSPPDGGRDEHCRRELLEHQPASNCTEGDVDATNHKIETRFFQTTHQIPPRARLGGNL